MNYIVEQDRILIIFVCYEPDLDFYLKIRELSYQILIVDNSINSKLCSKINQDNIKVISNLKNLGIAEALNIGCTYAINNSFGWVITMDQDSSLNSEIINKLIDYKNMCNISDIAVISPRHILQNNISSVSELKLCDDYYYGIHTMTSGNLVNLETFKAIGGFDAGLFIDHVDLDYYCKAIVGGYKVVTLNKVLMPHSLGNMKIHKFMGREFKVYHHNCIRKYYQIRNSIIVYNRYRAKLPESRFFLKSIIFIFGTTMLFEKDKLKKLYYMLHGVSDGIFKKTGSYDEIHL